MQLYSYSFSLSQDKNFRFAHTSIYIIFAAIKLKKTNKNNYMNNSIFANRSVGSIVNENYAAARIFKSFGIDFCCGGSAMLADACRTAGVEIEKVCEALDKNEATKCDSIPFASWPTDLLIDYVLKIHHRNIRSKGPQLLADILYRFLERYWGDGAQVAIIANGVYQKTFHDIRSFHDIGRRLAVCDFDAKLSQLGFAASDFTLVPSLFEPCGLPQMQGPIYGSLPIVHNTGGLHDTVEMIDVENHTGNGFIFDNYDSQGLFWAMDRAMDFWRRDTEVKNAEISRVMTESLGRFSHEVCAKHYIELYEKMLHRHLVRSFAE
jgi:glycosyltransferase involved in cell wall biosynthesis